MPTVKESFDLMPSRFKPDKAGGVNAVIQYDIAGEGGGTWHATIKDGKCTVTSGPAANPNLTLTMSGQDWLDMLTGKVSGQMAFMSGKLKLKGDMGLAMKIGSMFTVQACSTSRAIPTVLRSSATWNIRCSFITRLSR